MKARNGTAQDLAYWDTILGTYENQLERLPEKLKRELRSAHYSGRDEVCSQLRGTCKKAADILHHYRHMLGKVSRT